MRLFVALFPDKKTREYFRDTKQLMSKYKRNFLFTPIDQIHLTIKFLGNNVGEDTYKIYRDTLFEKLACFHSFKYEISDLKFGFPGQLIPSILFSKVINSAELNDLTDIATESAKNIDYHDIVSKKEHKKLIHHFTIGRVKTNKNKSFGRDFGIYLEGIPKPGFETEANEVAIVESELGEKGAKYRVLDVCKLK